MYHYKVISIERIVDGDTVDVVLDLGFSLYTKQRVRILGINTPELRSKDLAEKERASLAKQFAEEWFSSGEFTIRTTKDDKYGRILGDFQKDGGEESYSEAVLREGHGIAYNG